MSFSVVAPSEKLWPEDYYSPRLTPDHCREVLEGSYDVPVDPVNPVILDIGANVGAFARWAVQRWPGCTVHCYEPDPLNFALLTRTAEKLPNVHLTMAGVLDNTGDRLLYRVGLNCGESSFAPSGINPESTMAHVISATELPTADILKLDAEGGEMAILGTLEHAGRLGEFKSVMLEYHSGQSGISIIHGLVKAGYYLVGWKSFSEHRGELKFIHGPR